MSPGVREACGKDDTLVSCAAGGSPAKGKELGGFAGWIYPLQVPNLATHLAAGEVEEQDGEQEGGLHPLPGHTHPSLANNLCKKMNLRC